MSHKILIIDDDHDILLTARMFLEQLEFDVTVMSDPAQVLTRLSKEHFDVVLLDMNFQRGLTEGVEGLQWLERIRQHDSEMVVILMTAFGDVELAVKGIRAGAFDFILKPWQNAKLHASILSALKLKHTHQEKEKYRNVARTLEGDVELPFMHILGESDAIKKLKENIRIIAPTDASVLILGENGTGKELVARSIHRLSSREEGSFIGVDMGAIPETLFESELFGHQKGSFTGAVTDKIGLFEAAHGGTIFLDEIGDLPLSLQVKLLRIVQEKSFKPVGGTQEVSVDVRIISATNINLEENVINGEFREDLFYRLNVIQIRIPPLRERKMDIPILAQHFLGKYSQESGKEIRTISSYALKVLLDYSFPGNVRELENIVERSVALETSNIILPESLTLSRYKKEKHKSEVADTDIPPEGINLEEEVGKLEKHLLRKALKRTNGEMKKAAQLLNIPYRSIRYRLEKYGIKDTRIL